MNNQHIKQSVLHEIEHWSPPDRFKGYDPRENLVDLEEVRVKNYDGSYYLVILLWSEEAGYKIAYCPETKTYDLVEGRGPDYVYVEGYGSFIGALEGM